VQVKLGVSTSQGNLGFPLHKETWGFHFGRIWALQLARNVGFPADLVAVGGTSSGKDLEIADFVDVVEDSNDLRWGRM
jgi:hypothetical protein